MYVQILKGVRNLEFSQTLLGLVLETPEPKPAPPFTSALHVIQLDSDIFSLNAKGCNLTNRKIWGLLLFYCSSRWRSDCRDRNEEWRWAEEAEKAEEQHTPS